MSFSRVLLCAVIGLVLHAGSARADLIYDNLSTEQWDYVSVRSGGWAAQGFNSGNAPITLTSATLLLRANNNNTLSPTLQLFANNGGVPGASLANLTLVGSVPTAAYGSATFTSAGISLAANTNYWMVLSYLGGGGESDYNNLLRWGNSQTASTATSFIKYRTTGPYSDPLNDGGYAYDNTYAMMKLEGSQVTAVPEPASFVMMGLGLGGMGIVRRLRRKA